jgi:hopene-associated glycosyltransferase HpnB
MFLLLLSLVSLAAWFYLALFHGHFWRSGPELPPSTISSKTKKINVIIPARDEAESIEPCLRSLLAQQIDAQLTILLVDDNSADGTAQIATRISAEAATQGRLTILHGTPLAPGWSGKLWAVHQGLSHPAARAADYVLLTDADIEHAPTHLACLVAKAENEKIDLVSEMVRLHCETFAERALIPAFVFFFQMLYPFAWVADPARRTAGAAGGTMLLSRAALDRIGGVQGIRNALIDDCALAAQVKRTGGSLWLGHADDTRSLRVYSGPSEIWNMIARTAYVQLNHSLLALVGCILGMNLLYLLPPTLALSGILSAPFAGMTGIRNTPLASISALAAWLLMAALFQPTLRRYRRSPLWGLALPAIALFYLCATIASALRHYAGRGGGWKNRVYPDVG